MSEYTHIVYDRTGSSVREYITAESLDDAIRQGREWIEAGDWPDGDGERLPCEVREVVRHPDGSIDREATDAGEAHDCSGRLPARQAPECSDGEEHDWQSPYSVLGGVRENPGCWGSGHGSVRSTEVCARCGQYRTVDHGASDSSGQQMTRTTYLPADERSRAWVESL